MTCGKSLTKFTILNSLLTNCFPGGSLWICQKMDEKYEVTEKQKAFESCIKSFRPDIENYSNHY